MGTVNDNDVFARVKNGEVVEYPVYRLYIKNRGHSVSMYMPVVEKTKPELPAFHKYSVSKEVGQTTVTVSYSVVPMTLEEMLVSIRPKTTGIPPTVVVPNIADIPEATIRRINVLVSDYAEDKMNTFARTKNYTDMDRAIGYMNDPDPGFVADAMRCNELRSLTWRQLNAYFAEIMAGTKPVPLTIREFDAVIPEYTWS